MMKILNKTLITALFIFMTQSAFALSVGDIKAQKIAGEQANGYVGLVSDTASNEVKEVVSDVNSKRRAIYQKLAQQQKISLADVEKLAGERNINKTPSGQYVKDASGKWITKK